MTRSLLLRTIVSMLAAAPLAAQTSSTTTPWTVTIAPGMRALPIGVCGAVTLTLRDSTGKNTPRNPQGMLIGIADFDMTVAGANAADVVGQQNGPTNWSVCACQSASVGSAATITASYPAAALPAKDRVPGVQFTSTAPFVLAKPLGPIDPPACKSQLASSSAASTAATAPTQQGTRVTAKPITTAAPPGVKAPGNAFPSSGVGVGLRLLPTPASAPTHATGSVMTLSGSSFEIAYTEGGSATIGVSTAGGAITRSGTVSYEPIVIFVQPGGLMDPWINASWAGTASAMSGAINYPLTVATQGQLLFSSATLVSTTIDLSGGPPGKSQFGFRLVMAPAKTMAGLGTVPIPSSVSPTTPLWQPDKFVVTIPGVSTAGLVGIDPFEVSPPHAPSTSSAAQVAQVAQIAQIAQIAPTTTGATGVRSMLVTVREAQAADWFAWYDASIAGGVATEKTFTLDLISQIPGTRMAQISASGVGIVALRRMPMGKLVQAELYVKQIALLP